jgi:hypothetical protein
MVWHERAYLFHNPMGPIPHFRAHSCAGTPGAVSSDYVFAASGKGCLRFANLHLVRQFGDSGGTLLNQHWQRSRHDAGIRRALLQQLHPGLPLNEPTATSITTFNLSKFELLYFVYAGELRGERDLLWLGATS